LVNYNTILKKISKTLKSEYFVQMYDT